MAVNTRKLLHYHTLPFIVLAIGIVTATTLVTATVFTANTPQSLTRLLSVRLYDIKPSSNGLAHISRHSEAAFINTTETANLQINDLGQSASLQASVYSK